MKKFTAFLMAVIMITVPFVFSFAASAIVGAEDPVDISPEKLYILAKSKHYADENGYIFGVKARAVTYPEEIDGENQSDIHYFHIVFLYDISDIDAAKKTVSEDEDVLDVWYDKYELKGDVFVGANGKVYDYHYYDGVLSVALYRELPPRGEPDENGLYEFFGIKYKAIEYHKSHTNKTDTKICYFLQIHLPEGTDEKEAAEILMSSGEVYSAEQSYMIPMSALEIRGRIGDVDCDDKITPKDYALVKRYCLGTYDIELPLYYVADVNGDGEVNARDYAMIKRHCLGTYTIPESYFDMFG